MTNNVPFTLTVNGYNSFTGELVPNVPVPVPTPTPVPTPVPPVPTPPVPTPPAAITPTPPNLPYTTLAWEGWAATDNSLDLTKWDPSGFWYSHGATTVGGSELYLPSQVKLTDGILSLTALEQASGSYPWISGMVNSSPNGATPGYATPAGGYYIEWSANYPKAAPGLWPALWTLHNGGPYAELDAMEAVGTPVAGAYSTWHPASGSAPSVQLNPGPVDLSGTYHTYGYLCDKLGNVGWYLDGKLISTMALGAAAAVPMFIIMNMAIGKAGSWPGVYDDTTPSPSTLSVKYVRVFT
jgi:beta-glucanase (GH16 family)